MRLQFRWLNPLQRRAVEQLRLAGQDLAAKEFQVNGFFRIDMGDFLEERANGN